MPRLSGFLLAVALVAVCGCSAAGSDPRAEPVGPRDEASPPTVAAPGPGRPGRAPVVLAGDSMMASLTPALRAALGASASVAPFVLHPELARTEAAIVPQATALADRGELVVLMVGVWEGSVLSGGGNEQVDVDAPDWLATYRDRVVVPWLEAVTAAGSEVVWVGMTRVADPLHSLGLGRLSEAFRQATERVEGATFVDAGALLADPEGRFRPTISTADGQARRLVAVDGLHLCPEGAAVIADAVIPVLPAALRDQADPGWRATDWTEDDHVMGYDWYDAAHCG